MKDNDALGFTTEPQELIEKYKKRDVPVPFLTGILETEKLGLIYDEDAEFQKKEEVED